MATEGVEMQGTECPVCHENYNDPKILPCAHIFCRDCLVGWMKKKTEALCPLCCSAIVDPQDSSASNTDDIVDSLPTDHTMTVLMESVKIFSEEHVCYLHRSVSAPFWCLQCNVKLCQSCVDVHKSLPVTSGHKLENFSTLTLEGLTTTRREPCSLHSDKTSELFCTFHNVLICHVCATSKHRTCPEVICQQEMYEKCKQTLSELEDKLNVSISALSEVMTKIEKHQIKSEKSTMSAFEDIDITCNSLLNCVEACRKRLKKLVQEADDKIKAKVVEQKSSLGNRRGRLTAHLNLIQRVQQIAPCSSLVTMVPQLKDRITNLGLATALPEERQDFKMITLTIDRRALFLVERELEKIGDIVVSSSFAQVSNKETAEINQENKEYDFMSQGVCKLVIPANMLKEIMDNMTVSGLLGQMKFEGKDTEFPISHDEAAKLFVKHMSESRKQSEVLENKTDLIREMYVLEFEALKYLFGQDFTGLFQEMSKENSDMLKISVRLHNIEADQNLRDKLDSLRHKDLVLNPDEFEKIGFAIDAKAEGIAAFIKLLPDQGKLRISSCDYTAMSKAKHLVSVKLGKVKATARAHRNFDGGNTSSSGSYTNSPFQRSDPYCLAGVHKDFLTKSSIKVLVYKADITQMTLDVIVNAANENLSHGGGVAAAIARAAGVSLELEGDEYVMKNGPVPVTGVVMTCAGNLPCKKVFHAVGPRWDDYTDKVKCQQDLMQTVFNCLVKAHSQHFESIAVHSISSAIFGVPLALCALMYLAAIQKFEQQHGNDTTLKYIHFVDVNDDMVAIIQDTFSRNWDVTVDVIIDNEATNKKYTEQMKDQPLISLPSQIPSSKTESVSLPETKSVLLTLGPCREFITPTNMRVLVYKEDITKLSVDAIVNAANEFLKHEGGVSAAIAKAAGQKLIDDGKSLVKRRGKLSATDVVITSAGKLPCKYVLHAVGPRWNDYQDKQLCKNHLFITIFNCLEEAHRLLLGSLAVSSVSSAVQGVPKEVCAKMYFQAVQKFEESHGGNTSLKCIHFVDINPDMVGVIQDTFTEWWGSCSGHSEVRCSKGGNDATASAQLSGSQQQRAYSRRMMPVDTKQQHSFYPKLEIIPVEQNRNKKVHQYQFHFLKLDLIIQQQDIDCVLTDSIILWQTAGKKFFDDEISMRINTTSLGKQHRELSEVERNLKKGEMGVIIANNKQLLYPVITSRNDIKNSIRNALEAALSKMDEQKKKTVMMPWFPYAEKKGSKCFKEMLGEFATGVYMAVRNYTQRLNRSVTEVYIFDPDEDNVTTMANTIASKAGEDNSHIN